MSMNELEMKCQELRQLLLSRHSQRLTPLFLLLRCKLHFCPERIVPLPKGMERTAYRRAQLDLITTTTTAIQALEPDGLASANSFFHVCTSYMPKGQVLTGSS